VFVDDGLKREVGGQSARWHAGRSPRRCVLLCESAGAYRPWKQSLPIQRLRHAPPPSSCGSCPEHGPDIFPPLQLQQLAMLLQHSPQQSPHPPIQSPQQSPHPSKHARTPAQQPAMQLAKMSTPHGPERSQHRLSFSPTPPISWD
jgi:hypothetical protein